MLNNTTFWLIYQGLYTKFIFLLDVPYRKILLPALKMHFGLSKRNVILDVSHNVYITNDAPTTPADTEA